MTLRVYNTLSRKKEEFQPGAPGEVKMYVCGPTVYNYIHVGNARCYIVFDIIKRYLMFRGYKVLHAQNYTDIDDKIIKRAQEEGSSAQEIALKYTLAFEEDMAKLKVDPPDIKPRATEHLPEMIDIVKSLVEKGFAYEVQGDVYFSVSRFRDYGKLSHRRPKDLKAGERIEVDPRKKDPLDFALWKKAKPGEPSWPSPWGDGRPGWHLECSAMSLKYLGAGFDIHGGGQDLIFPHHENEKAQSEAYRDGAVFVRYWLHNGFVNIGEEKMAKSLGNVVQVREILDKYPSHALRTLFLGTHWRSPISFTEDNLKEAQEKYQRLLDVLINIDYVLSAEALDAAKEDSLEEDLKQAVKDCEKKFVEAMDDDFNSASALASLFELAQSVNLYLESEGQLRKSLEEARDLLVKLGEVLGLDLPHPGSPLLGFTLSAPRHPEESEEELFEDLRYDLDILRTELKTDTPRFRSTEEHLRMVVEDILSLREEARGEKEWAQADNLRNRLMQLGIVVEDRPGGIRWRLK